MTKDESIPRLDQIGPWSLIKLEIVKRYAAEYTKILSQQRGLSYAYIDAFSGAGIALSRTHGDYVLGSPLNALHTEPPFMKYFFIDMDNEKTEFLRSAAAGRANVIVLDGDANKVLLDFVFPQLNYRDYWRALCLLDPYGLHLNWDVVQAAGRSSAIEVFINLPVLDINRNVLLHDDTKRRPESTERMNKFWGDDSWRSLIYSKDVDLFGETADVRTETYKKLVEAYKRRLRDVAGFSYVPAPIPMRNSVGAILYYLYFASPNGVGGKIVTHIFKKFKSYK